MNIHTVNLWFCAVFITAGCVFANDEREELEKVVRMHSAGWNESAENWRFDAFLDPRVPGGRIVWAIKNVSNTERLLVFVPVRGQFEFLWQGVAPELRDKNAWNAWGEARARNPSLIKPGEQYRSSFLLNEYFVFKPGQRYVFRLKFFLNEHRLKGKDRAGIISSPVEYFAK